MLTRHQINEIINMLALKAREIFGDKLKDVILFGSFARENAVYLAKHRINTAKEDLETAIDLLKMRRYKGATNRACYAIFHCGIYACAFLLVQKRTWSRNIHWSRHEHRRLYHDFKKIMI